MKTPLVNYKTVLLNFFTNNRSLAGAVSKWMASNTATTLLQNSLFTSLTGVETQNNFAMHLNKS